MARKSKRHTCGLRACFHGAFSSMSDAKEKARTVRGSSVITRTINGKRRHVVITGK